MKKQVQSGIYSIRHRESGKCYVGSAVNFSKRWSGHRRRLAQNRHHSAHLQGAWNKYGPLAFEFVVMERVQVLTDLLVREQYWIDALRVCDRRHGYNVSPTAGSPLGVKHSAETRAKISAAMRGRTVTDETRARLSASAKLRDIAHLHSPESRAKAANARRGRPRPEYVKKLLSDQRLGKKLPPDWCAAMGKARRGIKLGPFSPEHCANISAARKGRPLSDEHRKALSVAAVRRGAPKLTREQIDRAAATRRGVKRTPEQKARMAAGRLAARLARDGQALAQT